MRKEISFGDVSESMLNINCDTRLFELAQSCGMVIAKGENGKQTNCYGLWTFTQYIYGYL